MFHVFLLFIFVGVRGRDEAHFIPAKIHTSASNSGISCIFATNFTTMKLLEGKNALVTGASRGIGKAIALQFAEEGANVAITYIHNQEKAEAVVAELTARGVQAKAYCCDAADFSATEKLVTQVLADFGHLNILVNNAGKTADTLMLRMTENQWDEVVATNLKSAFNTIHACAPIMLKQRAGSIINLSSVVGLYGNAGQANYAASKAGIIGLTKSMAKELGSRGIRVNAIAPGFIETDMTAGLSDEMKDNTLKAIALRRLGKTEDVARCALFLASELSSYVTGQVISCDGGM
jgi:3-oxoacyl-[acyl-carrier protein] reductase